MQRRAVQIALSAVFYHHTRVRRLEGNLVRNSPGLVYASNLDTDFPIPGGCFPTGGWRVILEWNLYDLSATAHSSDALPVVPPDLSAYGKAQNQNPIPPESVFGLSFFDPDPVQAFAAFITGTVTSAQLSEYTPAAVSPQGKVAATWGALKTAY
jgi:hypothetical protein